MFRNILKLSLRNFIGNRIYTLAIIFSLSIGFSVTSILAGFIIHELNADSFNLKRDRIFRVLSDDPFVQGKKMSYIQRWTLDYISQHFPEVETACMMYPLKQFDVSQVNDRNKLPGLKILSVDSSFFSLFDFPFYMGNRDHALQPGNIVLTTAAAKKLFGDTYSMAREVEIRLDTTSKVYNISGFTGSPTEVSHLNFDALVSHGNMKPEDGGIAYVLIHSGSNAFILQKKINDSGKAPGMMGEGKLKYYLQPLKKIYWDEDNTRTFSQARSRLFIWISGMVIIIIMFLATFNFLNLFILSFLRRWKEIGIKKTLGAGQYSLRLIALTEVSLYTLVSFVGSLLITSTFLPWFDKLSGTGLSFTYFKHLWILIILSFMITVISLIAILSLSRYLYSIKPVMLLSNKGQGRSHFSQWMIGIQFVISIILISCSLVMLRQIRFIRNKPLGFNRNIVEVRAPSDKLKQGLGVLKNKFLNIPGILAASVCSGSPISDNMIAWYGLENGKHYTPYIFAGDEDHLKTLGIRILIGSVPSPENKNARLVNEAFLRYFNMGNPLNTPIPGNKNNYICGVVNDFNIASLKQQIPPAIFSYTRESNCLLLKYDPDNLASILPALNRDWNKVYPDYPFQYLFVSDELILHHEEDLLFSRVISTATLISILITCFGLFALSLGISRYRSREIVIRKVIGASWISLILLLLSRFFKWMLIAYLIAVPVAWFLANRWLEDFVFKINLNIWIFLSAGIIIIAITLLTVGYQTLKSSRTNPVEELRYE